MPKGDSCDRWWLLVAVLLLSLTSAGVDATPITATNTKNRAPLGATRYGLGARAYTTTVDQWALFRRALGNEKERHGVELRQSLMKLRRRLGKPSLKLIDVGAADGELTSYYANLSHQPVLVDISRKLAERAKARPELKHARHVVQDIQKLVGAGLKGQVFRRSLRGKVDAIVMSNVLFALPDQVGTVDRAAKLLRPGGRALIIVTDDNCEFQQFRREYVQATGLNSGANFPHYKLIAGLKKRGYRVKHRSSPGTFKATIDDMIAMAPIIADTSPTELAKHPEAIAKLRQMLSKRAKNGVVQFDNPTVFIELEQER